MPPLEVGATRDLPEDLSPISAGIEDVGDLIADLESAFAATAIVADTVLDTTSSEVA